MNLDTEETHLLSFAHRLHAPLPKQHALGAASAVISAAPQVPKVFPGANGFRNLVANNRYRGSNFLSQVAGRTIIVVDDLYQSGLTLNYIAEELRAAGAEAVFGLAIVKTLRDDDNLPKPAGPPLGAPAPTADDDDDLDDASLF